MIRTFLMGVCLLGGTWFLASLRTTSFGLDGDPVWSAPLIWAIFVGPVAVLVLLGLPRRDFMLRFAGLWLASVLLSEGFARAQEIDVVSRHGQKPAARVSEKRWWPFGHHDITYTPGTGWSGND